FFQAEDGIRDRNVTGVQTCALPILGIFTVVGVNAGLQQGYGDNAFLLIFTGTVTGVGGGLLRDVMAGVPPYIFVRHIYACASIRSEERRVGKEWGPQRARSGCGRKR